MDRVSHACQIQQKLRKQENIQGRTGSAPPIICRAALSRSILHLAIKNPLWSSFQPPFEFSLPHGPWSLPVSLPLPEKRDCHRQKYTPADLWSWPMWQSAIDATTANKTSQLKFLPLDMPMQSVITFLNFSFSHQQIDTNATVQDGLDNNFLFLKCCL